MPISRAMLESPGATVFVESGCRDGRSIQLAIDAGFERSVACDISQVYVDHCSRRFGSRATLFVGDSARMLGDMLACVGGASYVLHLDAHQFIEGEPCGECRCPLLAEFSQFRAYCRTDAGNPPELILVDDSAESESRQGRISYGFPRSDDILNAILDNAILDVDSRFRFQRLNGSRSDEVLARRIVENFHQAAR